MIRNNPANTDIWPQPPPGGRHIRLDDVMDMEMSFTLPGSEYLRCVHGHISGHGQHYCE